MNYENLKINAKRGFFGERIDLVIFKKEDNKTFVAKGFDFVVHEQGSVVEEPIKITNEFAQELMDNLWYCGVRPSNSVGSIGQLQATENHLKDLQDYSNRLLVIVEKEFDKDK